MGMHFAPSTDYRTKTRRHETQDDFESRPADAVPAQVLQLALRKRNISYKI